MHLLVSLGALGRGGGSNVSWWWWGSQDHGKRKLLIKRRTDLFPQLKEWFSCTQMGSCICQCLWGHWEWGDWSNVSCLMHRSQDIGKRELLIKKWKTHWFSPFKKQFPVPGRSCAFAGVFEGFEKGEVGQMWVGCSTEVKLLDKQNHS